MTGSDPVLEALVLDVASRIRDAVVPHLGRFGSRAGVGVAPGGDTTMVIDEVAEEILDATCRVAGDIAYYSEDRGYVEIGRPRAVLVVDPIDGTRPAAAGLESCCVSVALLPPSREASLGDVTFGVVHEIKSGTRFVAARGYGTRAEAVDGGPVVLQLSPNTELDALFWTAGLRGRPALPVTIVLEDLIDGSTMRGGYFDLGSATFNMTRLVTGQLDAYIDIGRRVVDELPETESLFRAVGDGHVCTNFPYDVAAAALIVSEAGGVVTLADGRPLDTHPAIGSGDGFGLAVIASASSALHELLLDSVGRGMQRLVAFLGTDRPS